MKRKLLSTVLIGLFCFPPLFAGGQQNEGEVPQTNGILERIIEETDSYIVIVDDLGLTIKIEKPVNKIIILDGKSAHILRGISAENMVIAHGGSMPLKEKLFPVITSTPEVGSLHSLDYEEIVELNPDLIIASYFFEEEAIKKNISPFIPVVRLAFDNTEDITILGSILNKDKEAARYVNWIKGFTDTIADRIKELPESDIPKVFIYYGGTNGMNPPPPYGTYGRDNVFGNSLVEKAGGLSLSRELPGEWISVDPEWIIEQDPEIIVREYYDSQSENPVLGYEVTGRTEIQKVMNDIQISPAFESSTAVDENVHIIYGYVIQEYWFLGLNYLAKWFHPDLFEDFDPQAIHQEFLTQILRVDYDLNEQEVFAYPEE